MYVCMYVCMYACVYVCMYVCRGGWGDLCAVVTVASACVNGTQYRDVSAISAGTTVWATAAAVVKFSSTGRMAKRVQKSSVRACSLPSQKSYPPSERVKKKSVVKSVVKSNPPRHQCHMLLAI